MPAILVYVIFEPEQPKAVILRRSENWRETVLAGPNAVLALPEIEAELPLGALYG